MLVSRQTFTADDTWKRSENQWSVNAKDASADQYSTLDTLEQHRDADGAFTFRLVWPGSNSQTWRQTSNPVTGAPRGGVEGYEPIDVPYTGCAWGGLERGEGASLLDGSINSGNWWYAVGAKLGHGGGIPGPCGVVVQQVELYVFSSAAATPEPTLTLTSPP